MTIKRILVNIGCIFLYVFVSLLIFLFGVVPFKPIEPDLVSILWRVLFAGLWIVLGLWGSSRLKSNWSLLLMLPPVLIMILHVAGAVCLFTMPFGELIRQDTCLFATIAFVTSAIQLIVLIIKFVADARRG